MSITTGAGRPPATKWTPEQIAASELGKAATRMARMKRRAEQAMQDYKQAKQHYESLVRDISNGRP